jgi:hypothetical protein
MLNPPRKIPGYATDQQPPKIETLRRTPEVSDPSKSAAVSDMKKQKSLSKSRSKFCAVLLNDGARRREKRHGSLFIGRQGRAVRLMWPSREVSVEMSVGEAECERTERIDMAQNKTKFQGVVSEVMDITFFWTVTQCRLGICVRRSRGACSLHRQGNRRRYGLGTLRK